MGPVVLEAPPPVSQAEKPRLGSLPLTFTEVGHGYRPGWGLACSVIAHEVAFFLVVLFTLLSAVIRPSRVIENPRFELNRSTEVVYLPNVGGGSEGGGHAGGGAAGPRETASASPARSSHGASYRGQQPIVSDPPHPTNHRQTLLQPALENPPPLEKFVPLPNIVQMANAGPAPLPAPPREVIAVKPETVAISPSVTPIAAPKLTLPSSTKKVPDLTAVDPTLPVLKAVPKPPAPRPVEMSSVPISGRDHKSLVSLSAAPVPPAANVSIPLGETRGRFAISPEPTVAAPDTAPGSRIAAATSSTAGIGNQADTPLGDAAAGVPGTDSGGRGPQGVGGGGGTGKSGIGTGVGSNGRGGGTGQGRGTGSGPGIGSGNGNSLGSGTGTGSGAGRGGFPGITVQGGQLGSGAAGGTMNATIERHPTAYNMTIVSTASSGGGLPDFGVFSNEKVYTVYLDMKSGPDDPAPSWTLQYSLLHPATRSGPSVLKPPYAILKEIPELPAELAPTCARKLIVASAVLNAQGKLEQVSVKQSPESQLIAPLVEALSYWIFQPAELDGQSVSLKVLFGIRLVPRPEGPAHP